MERVKDIFRENGQIYDGSLDMGIRLYDAALETANEKLVMALTFPDNPILSSFKSYYGHSVLHAHCSHEQPNIVIAQFLIDFGMNVDATSVHGNTPLHLAVYNYKSTGDAHHLSIFKLLINNGANRDISNNDGLTPLQLSLFLGKLEVAEEFLNEEDKLFNGNKVDRRKRCRHLMQCLLKERNDWYVTINNYSVLLHLLIHENDEEAFLNVANNTKFDVNAFNYQERTLLHLVAEYGTAQMIRALVNVGADLDVVSKEDGTPLIIAILNSRTEIFHCLLDCGASIHVNDTYEGARSSPLHYAVCVQSFEMVEILLKKGADVNALTSYDRSPLLLACGGVYSSKWYPINQVNEGLIGAFSRKFENTNVLIGFNYNVRGFALSLKIVEILLDNGADIEVKTPSNRTALDQASRFGELEIVKLLLSRGAIIDQGDVSTLHHAVRGENPAIVALLLDRGANVNYRCAPEKMLWDDFHYKCPPPRTPLECALHFIYAQDSYCSEIVSILMKYGADVNVADPVRKETPLHLACLSNKNKYFLINISISRLETIKLLLEHNANVSSLDNKGLTPLHYALRNYILLSNVNTTKNSTNCLKPDLVALIVSIAKMVKRKEYLIEANLKLLDNEYARPIYKECVNELNLMNKKICKSRHFSFLNILTKDIEYLGGSLKNDDILQVLNSFKYEKNFPIYAGYLQKRIRDAQIRQRLIELSIFLFHEHVNENILIELMLNIFKFLNLKDFKNFAKACSVDVKSA